MVKILIIKKNTDIKILNAKSLTKEIIYKKCGLTTNKNFKKRHTWKIGDIYYSVFAKDKGKAGGENKYELPPPIDEKLYFGSLAIIKHDDIEMNSIKDLTEEVFNKVVEKLLGGYDDLNEDDTESEEEEKIPEEYKSKQGYSKEDGFIVSDDDVEFDDLNDSDYDESEEYIEQDDDDDGDEDSFEYDDIEEDDKEQHEENGDKEQHEDDDSDESDEEEDSDEYEDESDEEEYLTEESYLSSDDD